MSARHRVIHAPCCLLTLSSVHHVIYSPSWFMPFLYVIQSSIHHAIQSPYHPFTLPSIHTYHVVHSPCYLDRIMVHAIHLPCHPFTVSASHHVIQALSHHTTPRWRDQRSLTRKSSWSCSPCILPEKLCSTFWQRESSAARSLGLHMSRPAKSPGRSCPTHSPNLPYSHDCTLFTEAQLIRTGLVLWF